jgi:hypothetical protein
VVDARAAGDSRAASICGGWIGMEHFGAFLAPSVGALSAKPAIGVWN